MGDVGLGQMSGAATGEMAEGVTGGEQGQVQARPRATLAGLTKGHAVSVEADQADPRRRARGSLDESQGQ